jgi:hypothetical protein
MAGRLASKAAANTTIRIGDSSEATIIASRGGRAKDGRHDAATAEKMHVLIIHVSIAYTKLRSL